MNWASKPKKRDRKKATKELIEQIEEMAVEQYDKFHEHPGDEFDPNTGVKIKGMCDHDKLAKY